ncbi:hypothetical protein QTV43_000414 [Vibrio vulnificus]|nr:hypothetical protein [Vibrio vulnificus]
MKLINKLLTCLVVLLAISSAPSIASDDKPIDGSQVHYESVEDIFEPLSNKMALGLFGREGLVAFLGDFATEKQKEDVINLSDVEVSQFVAPFPESAFKVINAGMLVLYFTAFSFWVYLMGAYANNKLFNKQAGDDKYDESSKGALTSMLIKSMCSLFVCVPMVSFFTKDTYDGALSWAHVGSLKVFGIANHYAEKIDNLQTAVHPISAPIYKIPEPSYIYDTKRDAMDDLFGFTHCLAANFGRIDPAQVLANESINVTQDGNVDVSFSYPSVAPLCSIVFSQEIDTYTAANIQGIERATGEPAPIRARDYLEKQKQAFSYISREALTDAIQFTNVVLFEALSGRKNFKHEETGQSYDYDFKNWVAECPEDVTDIAKANNGTVVSFLGDTQRAKLCISKKMTEFYAYPAEVGDSFDELVLSNKSVFTNRKYQSCNIQSKADLSDPAILDDCFKKTCNAIAPKGKYSGVFECAMMTHAKSRVVKDGELSRLGYLVTPARYATEVLMNNIPQEPQKPLMNMGITSKVMSTTINAPIEEIRAKQSRFVKSLLSEAGNAEGSFIMPELPSYLGSTSHVNQSVSDVFGFNRLISCLKTPASVIEYSVLGVMEPVTILCQNPLVEFHTFGKHLFKVGTYITLGEMTHQAFSYSKTYANGKAKDKYNNSKKDGSIDQTLTDNELSSKIDSFRSTFDNIVSYVGYGSVFGLIGVAIIDDVASVAGVTGSGAPFGFTPVSGGSVLSDPLLAGALGFAASYAQSNFDIATGWITILIFVAAFICTFVIPFAPALITYTALIAVFANFIVAFLVVSFQIIYVLSGTQDAVEDKVKRFVSKWALIMLRTPLIVLGFYVAMHFLVTLLPVIVEYAFLADDLLLAGNRSIVVSFMATLIMVFVYVIFFGVIMFKIFDSISGLFLHTRSLVFGDNSVDAYGKVDTLSTLKNNGNYFKG